MKFIRYLASPFADPNKKRSAQGDSMYALDGIRGFAVLIVILSHTDAFGMNGQGSLGVLLFFMLSGFVLAIPFADHPERIFQPGAVPKFFVNRFLRIVPIFIVAVLCIRWQISETWAWVWTNLSFQGGWAHLWSVAEEVRFYALFPFVIATLALLPFRALRIAALIVMIWFAWEFQTAHPIDLMIGTSVEFYFWFFLAGTLSCLLYGPLARSPVADNRIAKILFGVISVMILLLVFMSSDEAIKEFWRPLFPSLPDYFVLHPFWRHELWCVMFGTLLISVTAFQDSSPGRLMKSWFLRHLGLLSYSLYLFHVPVLTELQRYGFQKYGLFFATFLVTYLIALASYITIEKPFLMLKPRAGHQPENDRSVAMAQP